MSTLRPMLAREADAPPSGDGWAFEVKWDGVRALAYADGEGGLRLESRRGEDVTARYPELAGLGKALVGRSATLDGEIVTFDEDGRPSVQLLQGRMGLTAAAAIARRAADVPVTYVIFDLLGLDGESMIALPYEERRRLLAELELDGSSWQTPGHRVGDGAALLQAARERGLEGVVAKRLESPYRPGRRGGEWIKVRNWRREALVIGGWMPGEGARGGRVGSVLVGYYDPGRGEEKGLGRAALVYAGGVGSGLAEEEVDRLTRLLGERERADSPFDVGVPKRRGARFCDPELVCEAKFTQWTDEGTLRQPVYLGLRDDVDPSEVVLDR